MTEGNRKAVLELRNQPKNNLCADCKAEGMCDNINTMSILFNHFPVEMNRSFAHPSVFRTGVGIHKPWYIYMY